MADAQSSAGQRIAQLDLLTGKATKSSLSHGYRDLEKYKAKRRRHYLKNREKYVLAQAKRVVQREIDGTAKDAKRRWRKAQRARFKALGLTIRGTPRKSIVIRIDRSGLNAELDARRAWRTWMKRAPNRWMRAYYRSLGKVWANPRLSPAAKWRIQYWLDPAFRAREIEKVLRLKLKRAALIASTDDGTLSGAVVVALYAAAKDCPYCDRRMRSVEKTVDHVVPLTLGGVHSITNVLICCKTCNTKKARKPLDLWLAQIGKAADVFSRFFLAKESAGCWHRCCCLATTSL